ncbi:MAG: cytochrome b N-terminal domain-containing protein [Ignavibacteria bacterium]|nr:cytochrome b N-terminal domain-containing protein [Ignavibacteria bacterium]MBK7412641.1 cytochrome b N-terminal domain-containing protein [Ignavibacteria bacterium]
MNPHWTDRLSAATARLGLILSAMVVVQVITGILLSMWYVPSRSAATMPDGTLASITTVQRLEIVGSFVDTLGVDGRPTLVPARRGDAVPSQAAASVAVSIANAPAGEFIRTIHHNNTAWLYTLSILWLVLLTVSKAFRADAATWIRAVSAVILVLIAAWSGRLLPDDVYAEISRRIVGHELQEAPFGSFIATLFGVEPNHPLLSRTFVLHILVGAALTTTLWKPFSAMKGAAITAIAVIAVVLGTAFIPLESWPVRDVVGGLNGQVHAEPWWVIRPFHTLVEWFGAELAGYLLLALTLTLLFLPIRKRNPVTE